MSDRLLSAEAVLDRWGLTGAELTELPGGNINWTYRVRTHRPSDADFVLQRIAPIFSPQMCDDVARVSLHLANKGIETPQVVPTLAGELKAITDTGDVYRLSTFIEGITIQRVDSPQRAEEAGRALGVFHRGLADYPMEFSARRLGVHDTARHLAGLKAALTSHRAHPRFDVVAPIAHRILEHALPPLPELDERVVHGDPKLANLIFDATTGRAKAWVDLDTVAPMALPLEIGDALRSWCNPGGEDRGEVEFDPKTLEAAIAGYAEGSHGLPTPTEAGAFISATETIALELAARFCRDALEEQYFGWNTDRFASASHHHEARARSQLDLARSVAERREAAEAIVARSFPRPPSDRT